jgi:hypothetical protein
MRRFLCEIASFRYLESALRSLLAAIAYLLCLGFLLLVPVIIIPDFTCFHAIGCPLQPTPFPARLSVFEYMDGSGAIILGALVRQGDKPFNSSSGASREMSVLPEAVPEGVILGSESEEMLRYGLIEGHSMSIQPAC